jgi:hypothetical protein
MKAYVGVNTAKLEIKLNVKMYLLCVSEDVRWNGNEPLTYGINGKYAVN